MSDMTLSEAICLVAAEVGPINKDETNREQGFKFRSIEAITDRVRVLLAKQGVVIVPKVISYEYSEQVAKSGAKGIRCVANMGYTVKGHGEEIEGGMLGEAVDYGDKSTSKAVQMAYKYFITELLTIGSGEADADKHTVDIGTVVPREEIVRRRLNGMKTSLTRAFQGKAESAAETWTEILALHGFAKGESPDPSSSDELLDAVEADLKAEIERIGK